MLFAIEYNHRGAKEVLQALDMYAFVRSLVDAPAVGIKPGAAPLVKDHIEGLLTTKGWAMPTQVRDGYKPNLNAAFGTQVVLQVQTGNIARGFYDLLKMEAVFAQGRAECGVLIVPANGASRKLGGNLADFSRIAEELSVLYEPVITMPVLLLGFE